VWAPGHLVACMICIHETIYCYLFYTRRRRVMWNILLCITVKFLPFHRFESFLKTGVRRIENTFGRCVRKQESSLFLLANYCFHALFFLLIREPVAVETVGRLVSHLSAITWPSLPNNSRDASWLWVPFCSCCCCWIPVGLCNAVPVHSCHQQYRPLARVLVTLAGIAVPSSQ
jgi:hypothetical protein